ncbi:MAG: hypothetical protein WC280_02020 [Patescibacteria group bacterium]
MNKFENRDSSIDNSCNSKSNSVARAIEGSDSKYNPNVQRVENKLNKAVDEISEKFNLDKSPETRELLSIKVLKSAIEKIAEEFNGVLPDKEDLNAKYFELILNEALLKEDDVEDYEDIVRIVSFLDKKNILDNSKKGKIIDIVAKKFLK